MEVLVLVQIALDRLDRATVSAPPGGNKKRPTKHEPSGFALPYFVYIISKE